VETEVDRDVETFTVITGRARITGGIMAVRSVAKDGAETTGEVRGRDRTVPLTTDAVKRIRETPSVRAKRSLKLRLAVKRFSRRTGPLRYVST